MAIKKKDFIEVDFTGTVKDTKQIFDTTIESVAKENHLPDKDYKPIIICVGEGHLVKGLDEGLIGKEQGKHSFDLKAEEAFGKKDAKLIEMIPLSKFKEHKIDPTPGLQLNIDGDLGTVLRVSGGRVMLDFNHPLAGRDIIYEIDVKRVVTDKKEQVESIIGLIGIPAEVKIEDDKATISLPKELPKPITDKIGEKIKELTTLKDITWSTSSTATTPQQ